MVRFGGYRLEPVYGDVSETERREAITMWQSAGAHRHPETAVARSHEIALLVRAPGGELAGVSTVEMSQPQADGRPWYVFRMFLRPEHRRPYLMRAVTNTTRDFLGSYRHPHAHPSGMLILTENPKLMRTGIKRYLARHGYVLLGRTSGGLDAWLARFPRA